jgi:hypothetical protein
MFVCCECCVLSGRGLCDGLITRPEKSYRMWRVVVLWSRNLEHEETKARYRAVKIQPQWVVTPGKQTNNGRPLLSAFQTLAVNSSEFSNWNDEIREHSDFQNVAVYFTNSHNC